MSSRNKTGLMNIKPDKISYKILQWVQEHEGTNALKNTTGHIIAEKIAALPGIENGELTIEQTFSKMIKSDIIYRDRHEKSIYSDFRINYWHKSIPSDILANAPAEVKRAMAKTIDDMKPDQYMDDSGCVVTPNAVEKTEDPFNENETVEESEEDAHENEETVESEPGTFENPIVEDKGPWEEETTTIHKGPWEEGTTTIPLQIRKEKDGKTTNVTINLTINI